MLLKLIRNRETRYRYHGTLYEIKPYGKRKLVNVSESKKEAPLELFYRLSVSSRKIWIGGKHYTWRWENPQDRFRLLKRLKKIQRTREEMRIEITHWEPDYPYYPRSLPPFLPASDEQAYNEAESEETAALLNDE